jgi:hypothetical protein
MIDTRTDPARFVDACHCTLQLRHRNTNVAWARSSDSGARVMRMRNLRTTDRFSIARIESRESGERNAMRLAECASVRPTVSARAKVDRFARQLGRAAPEWTKVINVLISGCYGSTLAERTLTSAIVLRPSAGGARPFSPSAP